MVNMEYREKKKEPIQVRLTCLKTRQNRLTDLVVAKWEAGAEGKIGSFRLAGANYDLQNA